MDREHWEGAVTALKEAGVEDPLWDARELLEWAGGPDRTHLPLTDMSGLAPAVWNRFWEGIRLREKRIPLQQITGTAFFMGLSFKVNDKVLCPRQDTEVLVERGIALMQHKQSPRILDLCCGSGCIGLSLAWYLPKAQLVLSDISDHALKLARENAGLLKLTERVRFARGDLFAARLEETDKPLAADSFDLICCNPPYIPSGEIEGLMPEVRDHEPRMALDGGKDGLDFYRRLAAEAGSQNKRTSLLLEIGAEQGKAVKDLLEEAGWDPVQVHRDLAGLDRVVEAKGN